MPNIITVGARISTYEFWGRHKPSDPSNPKALCCDSLTGASPGLHVALLFFPVTLSVTTSVGQKAHMAEQLTLQVGIVAERFFTPAPLKPSRAMGSSEKELGHIQRWYVLPPKFTKAHFYGHSQ